MPGVRCAHAAVNLGQGFPDWETPAFVQAAAERAIRENHNQYTRAAGHPMLVRALAEAYGPLLGPRTVDPLAEVCVTVGASGALYSAIQALVEPGDEVVLLEPSYDLYSPAVQVAGARAVRVPLRRRREARLDDDSATSPLAIGGARVGGLPPQRTPAHGTRERHGDNRFEKKGHDAVFRIPLPFPSSFSSSSSSPPRADAFHLDADELAAAVTPRTRALLLNTPHNPTGKIFSASELESIAAIVRKHPRLVVLTDEVYEWMVYPDATGRTTPLPRFAALPGMWDQTVTISSAGKTFSNTGWKIGWCVGPSPLIAPIQIMNQWIQYCVTTPFQVRARPSGLGWSLFLSPKEGKVVKVVKRTKLSKRMKLSKRTGKKERRLDVVESVNGLRR